MAKHHQRATGGKRWTYAAGGSFRRHGGRLYSTARQRRYGALATGGKSLLLAPYWLDGHYLSAQTAQRLGYHDAAEAIREEVIRFLTRLPRLATLLFNDHTPFISELTTQWLATVKDDRRTTVPAMQANEEYQTVRVRFTSQGLEAALQYLEALPEGSPRDQFHRQYLGAQLMEEAGMEKLAQQQYRMLFLLGQQMKLSDWEPSLLEQLEHKFTAEK
jgi:type VI secretion system protein VasJ